MADNRLWLCHRQSGLAVLLAKRIGDLMWYQRQDRGGLEDAIETLFGSVEDGVHGEGWDGDDFVLLKESDGGFDYGETLPNGLRRIIFK